MFKRGKGKYNSEYSLSDLYNHYNLKYKNTVSKKVFKKVIQDYFDLLIPEVINNNLEFRLPCKLGYFRIKSKEYKPKLDENGDLDRHSLIIDYGKTLKLWNRLYPGKTAEEIKLIPNKKLVYYLNEHSDNKRYLWFWDKCTCNVQNQSYFKIEVTRKWDRTLSKTSKEKHIIYYQ